MSVLEDRKAWWNSLGSLTKLSFEETVALTEMVDNLLAEAEDVAALRLRVETAEKDAVEAYAKGQRDFQERAAKSLRDHKSEILHTAAELLMSLPIKERP